MRKPTIWVPTRSDTNRAIQSQKMVRGWKFRIYKVEKLYYLCSENKGADQLRSYCEADLRLCFRLCRLLVFPYGGSIIRIASLFGQKIPKLMSWNSKMYSWKSRRPVFVTRLIWFLFIIPCIHDLIFCFLHCL